MYTAEELKTDLLSNLRVDARFSDGIFQAIENSQFEFEDSAAFSRREWNTYSRVLKIFCRTQDKTIIESSKKSLYDLCDVIHGVKDNCMLMQLVILVKQSLDNMEITRNEIIITTKTIIDKANDYSGSGGFATIYKKTDNGTGMEYAYKIFDPSPFQISDDGIMKNRFIREAKKLLGYSHENIVHAYDFGFLGDNSAYIKMEFVKGKNVFDYIKHAYLLPTDKMRLARQYISAMAYIHVKSDVHRDISYSNVMITDSGDIKVLDFGFARNDDDTNYDTAYADIAHKFNPPDSIYDVRTEVYCMGGILFTIISEMEFHISKLCQLNDFECEDVLKNAINKCLQINPNDRFQNAIDLQNYIESKDENFKERLSPSYNNDDFSLDPFKNEMENIGRIRFIEGTLPTLSTIKSWLEVRFTDCLVRHRFLSTINITQLLIKINGVKGISTYKNVNYEIDKEIFSNIIDAYERFSDADKMYLIKGIQTIILSKSIEEEDLPF